MGRHDISSLPSRLRGVGCVRQAKLTFAPGRTGIAADRTSRLAPHAARPAPRRGPAPADIPA